MGKKTVGGGDHDDSRRMPKAFLELNDHCVLEAVDGGEAVAKAVEEKSNLTLADAAMPALEGVQAANVIRQHGSL